MAGAFTTIEVTNRDRVLTVRLNRPAARNALNTEMSIELAAAVRLAQRDEHVRCLVLTGAGSAFCAGLDLRELAAAHAANGTHAFDFGAYLRETLNPLILRLRTMDKPVVAALNGTVAGGGLGLALAADVRLCTADTTFVAAFIELGLTPDAGSSAALVRLLGLGGAAAFFMLNEPLTAAQALTHGVVQRVVPADALAAAAEEWGQRLASKSARALALTKRTLQRATTTALEEQLEHEAYTQTTAGRLPDHQEGLAAFLDRRPPDFSHF